MVEELWGAGAEAIAVNGERITPTSAIIDVGTSLLVNSAYLTPPYQITALGPPDLYDRLSASAGLRRLRARPERGLRHPRLARRAGVGRHAGLRRDGDPALLAAARVAVGRAVVGFRLEPGRAADDAPALEPAHDRRGRADPRPARRHPAPLAGGPSGLAQLSSQDLTVLVANLNARNDQLRRESSIARAGAGDAHREPRRAATSRSTRSPPTSQRVRAYAGLDPVGGPGVTISVRGPIDGTGVEELINELRNAGAEAIALAASGS